MSILRRVLACGLGCWASVALAQPSPILTPLVVTGRVLDAQERPLVGLGIELLGSGEPASAVASTRTGEDGLLFLLAPKPGTYRLRFGAGSSREQTLTIRGAVGLPLVRLGASAPLAPLPPLPAPDVPLCELRGRVLTTGGAPVLGAEVVVGPARDGEPWARAWTDSKGRFWLSSVPSGEPLVLVARGPQEQLVERRLAPLPPGPAQPLEIKLETTRSLAGWLRWADGEPAAGLEVRALPGGFEDPAVVPSPPALGRARSDARGHFELALDSALDRHELDLVVVDGETVIFVWPRVPTPAVGDRRDLGVVDLPAAQSFEGVVSDTRAEPVPEAHVSLRGAGEVELQQMRTGRDGRFRFEPVRGRGLQLAVDHPRFLPQRVDLGGIEGPLQVVLESGPGLAGRVVDTHGFAIAAAEVTARLRPDDGKPEVTVAASSDPSGRFELVLPVGTVDLGIRAAGFQPLERLGIESTEGEIELRLTAAGILEGRVVDEQGRPVPGALLRLASLDEEAEWASTADEFGGFYLDDVRPGRHWLVAEFEDQTAGPVAIDLAPGGRRQVELRVGAQAALEGRVVDAAGHPLPDVRIEWLRNGRAFQVTSDPAGYFEFPEPVLDPLVLGVRKPGFQPSEVTRSPGDRELLVVVLVRGTLVRGRLVGAADWRGAEVAALGSSHAVVGTVAPDGHYRLDGLGPGEWSLVAGLADGRQAHRRLLIRPEVSTVETDLEFSTTPP